MLFRDSSFFPRAWIDVALNVNGYSCSRDDIRGGTVRLCKTTLPHLRNYLAIKSDNFLYADSLPRFWLTKILLGVPQYVLWRHPVVYCDMGCTICGNESRMREPTYAIYSMILREFRLNIHEE